MSLSDESDSEDEPTIVDEGKSSGIDPETKKFIEGLSFANVKIRCYKCGEPDHISPNCPQLKNNRQKKVGVTMTTVAEEINYEEEEIDEESFGQCEFALNTVSIQQNHGLTETQKILMERKKLVDENWLLLDNQSTINIFKNKDLLHNVRQVESGQGARS